MRLAPLTELEGKKIGDYMLHLGKIKQLRLSSWKGFELYIKRSDGLLSHTPVIKGIHSSGAKDGVKSWMDLIYWEKLEFRKGEKLLENLSLSSKGLDRYIFQILGDLIAPGGHMMVSYEGNDPIHIDTRKSLGLRIPAAVTPLGFLLFGSGFQLIKNWYLSEGGFEGPRKLWAEKAPDKNWAKTFYQKTAEQIKSFFERDRSSEFKILWESARQRARDILEIIDKKRT